MEITHGSSGAAGSGVSSLSVTGDVELTGDITLSEGANITLTQVGQDIEIASTGGSPSGADTSLQFNSSGSFGGSKLLYTTDDYHAVLTSEAQSLVDDNGVSVEIYSSDANGTGGDGGAVKLTAGDAEVTNYRGSSLELGGGSLNGDRGGNISLVAGAVETDGRGGAVSVNGGNAGTGTGNGGAIDLYAGNGGATSGNGATATLSAGSAQAGDSNGGNAYIQAGSPSGAGTVGRVYIRDGSAGGFYAVVDTDALSADRTFAFPNQSGTIALTSDIPAGGIAGQATVDFGAVSQEDAIARVTVPTVSALSSSIITVSPAGIATADHDPDDYQWDNISGYVSNIINGVSFDIIGVAPNGAFGDYAFNYAIN